jgi:poly(A) polymerase
VNAYETSARQAAVEVVRTLRKAGQVAYFAGGCVRDALLGRSPQDYDVATDAKPERVRVLFKRSRFVGEAFGVVLVTLAGAASGGQRDDHPVTRDGRWLHAIEVATFRTEWGYADGRRPTGVAFTDAQTDARRRDFTVNGLFEDPLADAPEQRIIDYVGGLTDLKAGVLRAIGEPDERFGEDYLRLLRAVRFAARLGFRLDPRTTAAIGRHAPQLGRISRERIGQEVEAMLSGPHPARCVRLMQRLGLDGPALNETVMAVPVPTVVALARLKRHESVGATTLLAAWLVDRHLRPVLAAATPLDAAEHHIVPAVLARWRAALCLPNEQRDALRHILAALPDAFAWASLGVARRKRLLARSTWPAAWQVLRAMRWLPAAALLARTIDLESAPLLAEGVAPAPLVTGDDLVALGIRPGPGMGKLLESLYDAQLEKAISTREEALALAAKGG